VALERTALIGRSATRGRRGSTVAWVRAGVLLKMPLGTMMRNALAAIARARAAGNVPPLEQPRTTTTVGVSNGVRGGTFRADRPLDTPAPPGQRPVAAAMRAARRLLDPRLFPDQAR
jgi:hypothetical protein